MATKLKVVPTDPVARSHYQFANFVTETAFNLTLTKQMVDGLMLVRDFGNAPEKTERNERMYLFRKHGVTSRWIAVMTSLERRGMVYNNGKSRRAWQLTEIGEMAVRMCVIAGLMPADKVDV